jgi:hypothetical protein
LGLRDAKTKKYSSDFEFSFVIFNIIFLKIFV